MAKDKKGKGDDKKAKLAAKKAKQANKAEKKAKVKASKVEGSDAEDVDLDEVLEEYRKQQELFLKVTETVCDGPPKARAASCFIASPCDRNNLLLFGGEYFNGALAQFFNDLHIYYVDRDEWRLGTFHHYSDFWRLEPSTREWTKIECKGKTPPARSGHRMTYWKHYIILFGGFQDTSNQTKYLADLWIFDTQNFSWHTPTLPPAQLKPDARSSFTLLPHEKGAVLYGGYSRVKATVAANKQAKGASQGHKNVLRPLIHDDCFFLRMAPAPEGSPPTAPPVIRWERRKKPANAPESEDGMDSEFFRELFAWNVERNRFFPMALRKPRQQQGKKAAGADQRGAGRRARAQDREDELLKQLAALETGASLEDADDMDLDRKADEPEADETPLREMPVSMELPHPRFNAQMAVQDDVLYIYGGTFEQKDREFTFDDLYAIDLGKMDGCKEIFNRPAEDWFDSEDEDDDDDEDDEEDSEEDDEDDDMADDEPAKNMHTPGKRKKKQEDEVSVGGSETTAATSVPDDDDTEATASVDDGLPHPRPFETRREFFVRTSNEWQEVLMTQLRWKNIQPESYPIKELKAKAFELSEEKWWDCREEINALEEEQEAAGITEVVSLAERGDAAAGGARRR
ncbi:hypothetical protein VdG1_03027 [Verticillium dahliae VDG1]|nr:hypothetical protein VdG1_03027 [Verticillium dahliae VDG1]